MNADTLVVNVPSAIVVLTLNTAATAVDPWTLVYFSAIAVFALTFLITLLYACMHRGSLEYTRRVAEETLQEAQTTNEPSRATTEAVSSTATSMRHLGSHSGRQRTENSVYTV